VDYPDSLADGRGVWMTLLSTTVLIVVAAGAWAYRKRHPFVLFGLLWSYLSLVPVLNLFPTIPVVADRYAYPVILGFAMVLAYGLTRLQDRRTGAAGLMAAGAVLLLWSAVNITRSYDWRTEEALFRSSLGSYKGASGVNYALALWSNGRYEQALDVLRAEHARTGDYRYSQYQGKLLMMSGKIAEAIPLFERSLREGGDAWRRPHYDLALAYEQAGMHGPALAHFLKTVETRNADMFGSELRSAHEGIERVRSVYQAQLAEGRRRALEQPGGFAAQASYAYLLQTVGLYDEAVVFYRRAIDLDRGRWEPWYNMGLAYMRSRQYRDAIQAFQRSLGIKPDNKEALNNSGTCFAALADYGNAEQHFRKALTVDPVFEYAAYNLARLYFAEGKADEAKKMLGHLSRISPGNAEMQARLQQYRRMLE